MKREEQISPSDLNAIIMSVVHDVKNSLLLSTGTLEQINLKVPRELQAEIATVQDEIKGINQSLMRMLTLYKMQTNVFSLHRDQYNVYDFLEELVLTNASLNSKKSLTFEIECDEYLDWFFDLELISNVINSIINNTIRYAKSIVILHASIKDDMLQIKINDDGVGYPQTMLEQKEQINTQINFAIGNSGLGLFFAEKIAQLHTNLDKQGYTQINNRASGGGCFTICLP
ncbi:MAG: HAMP domain-containing sensor histidine kinase [Pseudomonadota bacterium]